jgi:hypothetical protein
MNENTKQKIVAGAKIGFGVARMASAVATAGGIGIVGGLLRHHGMLRAAGPIAKHSFLGGKEMFAQGLAEWNAIK